MKEVKHYICETCGEQYIDKNLAQECEETHCNVVGIEEVKYSACERYPSIIEVEMQDGQVVIYKTRGIEGGIIWH